MDNQNPKSPDSSVTKLLALNFLAIASTNSCLNSAGSFWVRNITSSTQTSSCVSANLVSSSSTLDIYVQKTLSLNLNFAAIASTYTNQILPAEISALGVASDINRDGKITLLILDIVDGASVGTGFIAGFVDPVNFFQDNAVFATRSNEREILYLDGVELVKLRDRDLALNRPDPFLSTLAHELQHLIRFQHSQGNDDPWIDEGTSEVISDITGFGPQSARLACFRGDISSSTSCSGGIGSTSTSSPSLFKWNGNLKNYAFSYSFMRYLYDSSGSSAAARNLFFMDTVKGLNKVRGDNATNLTQLFMNSPGYNASVLSSTNQIVFQRLFASFLAQSVGYPNLNQVYIGNTNSVDLDFVRTTYPFSTTLSTLPTPQPFNAISASTSHVLAPSQVNRVLGTTSGITNGLTNFIAIQGSDSYLIFNANNLSAATTQIAQTNFLDSNSNDKICPHVFLSNDMKQQNNTKKRKMISLE